MAGSRVTNGIPADGPDSGLVRDRLRAAFRRERLAGLALFALVLGAIGLVYFITVQPAPSAIAVIGAVAEESLAADTPPVTVRGENAGVCDECGVVESSAQGALTVRLQNGERRVIADEYPGRWRTGERIKLIGGSP